MLTSLGGLDDYAVVGPADDGHLGRVRDTCVVRTDLTRHELAEAPGADTDRPVSGQHALDLARYYGFYGFPYHWLGTVQVSEQWRAAGGGEGAVVTLAPRLRRAGDRHLQSPTSSSETRRGRFATWSWGSGVGSRGDACWCRWGGSPG